MAATLETIKQLLDAGYSKAEIDQLTAEQNPDENPENEEPAEAPENEEPAEAPDPFEPYKDRLDQVFKELDKATKEIQQFNVRHSSQPEVKKEDAGDILFNTVATILPPPGSKGEKK